MAIKMNKSPLFWVGLEKGDDALLVIGNDSLYKASKISTPVETLLADLNKGTVSADFFSLPFSYINQVYWQEGSKHIEIQFNKESTEHLTFSNDDIRFEILDALKASFPGTKIRIIKKDWLEATYQILIGLLLVSLYVGNALYHTFNGIPISVGRRAYSDVLTNLGVGPIIFTYAVIFALFVVGIRRRLKHNYPIHLLKIRKTENLPLFRKHR